MSQPTLQDLLPHRIPLQITAVEPVVTREELAERPWMDPDTRASLEQAALVFVPWETFPDLEVPVYPVGTGELYRYVQEHAPPDIHGEIAVPDADYVELALHADVVYLPTILMWGAGAVVVPVAVNLISEFLKKLLLERHKKADVTFECILQEPGGRFQALRYEGPAEGFESLLLHRAAEVGWIDGSVLKESGAPDLPPSIGDGDSSTGR